MNEPDDLLATAEVALILRAPASTVRYWRSLHTGPKSFKLGRRVVYRRADVRTWVAEQEAAAGGRAAS
jgi:predicted DNA-binding transcriptional regulator AlpA